MESTEHTTQTPLEPNSHSYPHRYDDPASTYSVGCVLEFESKEHFQKAGASEEAKAVFGDIDNFSNEKPTIVAGEVKEVKEV